MDHTVANLLSKRKGTPVTFEEFLRFREETNQILKALESDIRKLQSDVSSLIPEKVNSNDYIQQSIDALELELGTLVQIKSDFFVSESDLSKQIGDQKTTLLMESLNEKRHPNTRLNFKDCQAVILNKDDKNKKILVRTFTKVPILILINESQVSIVQNTEPIGLIDSEFKNDLEV